MSMQVTLARFRGGCWWVTVALWCVIACAVPSPVAAQCNGRWAPGQGRPGTDGVVWCVHPLANGDVIFGGFFEVASDLRANSIVRFTPSTRTWATLGTGLTAGPSTPGFVHASLALPDGDIIVTGEFSAAGGVPAHNIARYRPSTGGWSALGEGLQYVGRSGASGRALALLADGRVVVGGDFGIAGGVPAASLAVFDPASGRWSPLGNGAGLGLEAYRPLVSEVAESPLGEIVVAGAFDSAGGRPAGGVAMFSPATGEWSDMAGGLSANLLDGDGVVSGMAVLPTGEVVVGGAFDFAGEVNARNIAKFDPRDGSWAPLGAGVEFMNSDALPVQAIEVLPGGDLVISGAFWSAGGVPAQNVARYNSTDSTWSPVGAGTYGNPDWLAGAVFDSALSADGTLFVAGSFERAGDKPAENVASCDLGGQVWSGLASGFNLPVSILRVLPDGDVLAVGAFTSVDDSLAEGAARLDSATNEWSSLGSGLPPETSDVVALPDGDLLAGGWEQILSGGRRAILARYDAESNEWSRLSDPPGGLYSNSIYSLGVLPGGDVVVGGSFASVAGIPVRNIARYSPSTGGWSAMGSGVGGVVSEVLVLRNGDVVVSGGFEEAGGHPARAIAKFGVATQTWSAMGLGLAIPEGYWRSVACLAEGLDGQVIVGGFFRVAGGQPAEGIARYDFSTGEWDSLSAPPAGSSEAVHAIAVLADGDIVLGGYFPAPVAEPRGLKRFDVASRGWSTIEGGLTDVVETLAISSEGDLLVGGWFLNAGDQVSAYFARFVFRGPDDCRADFTCDGRADSDDVIAFFGLWDQGALGADFDADADVDADDVIAFFAEWDAGC
ncbi:MAG: hypothetical protein ACOYN0_04650 [Phycisphaerales bacterium]